MTITSYKQNEFGDYVPAIPEPFWVRHWLFWERPSCYCCRLKFRNRAEWDEHYTKHHLLSDSEPSIGRSEMSAQGEQDACYCGELLPGKTCLVCKLKEAESKLAAAEAQQIK